MRKIHITTNTFRYGIMMMKKNINVDKMIKCKVRREKVNCRPLLFVKYFETLEDPDLALKHQA